MLVAFRRSGVRRYAVVVSSPGRFVRALDPAPGYDDDIPHDLVHYVVEAELGLKYGVYGCAERGGGGFIDTAQRDSSPRERARAQRKQKKRELSLRSHDASHHAEMALSERLAAVCDVAWRRRRGQRPDLSRPAPMLRAEDAARVARVVARLNAIAVLWRELGANDELVFEWPTTTPRKCSTTDALAQLG